MYNSIVKVLPTSIIVLLSLMLSLALHSYAGRLQSQLLEGNNLYSDHAVFVDDTPGAVLDSLKLLGQDARAFNVLEDYGGVRVITANDFRQIALPLHEGTGFTNEDSREAIVGSNIDTRIDEAGRRYLEFDGNRYEVMGLLGARADSILSMDILLKDDGLFRNAAAAALVLDGDSASAAYAAAAPTATMESFDNGVDRRTSIDFVSPVLFGAGGLLVFLGFVCAGLLYGQKRAPESRVLELVGYSRRRVYGAQLALLVILVGTMTLISAVVSTHAIPSRPIPLSFYLLVGVGAAVSVGLASIVPQLARGRM